jgi:hypothetical protein
MDVSIFTGDGAFPANRTTPSTAPSVSGFNAAAGFATASPPPPGPDLHPTAAYSTTTPITTNQPLFQAFIIPHSSYGAPFC